jgi:hypothetical protein
MLSDFYQPIIPYYSPISAKGGRRTRRRHRSFGRKLSSPSFPVASLEEDIIKL